MYNEGSVVGDVLAGERIKELIQNATIEDVAFNLAEKTATVNQHIEDVTAACVMIGLFTAFVIILAFIVITNRKDAAAAHLNQITSDASATIARDQQVPLEVAARGRIHTQAIDTEEKIQATVNTAHNEIDAAYQRAMNNLQQEGATQITAVQQEGMQQSAGVRVAAESIQLHEQIVNIRQQGATAIETINKVGKAAVAARDIQTVIIIVPDATTGAVAEVVAEEIAKVDPQAVVETIPIIIPKIMEFLM